MADVYGIMPHSGPIKKRSALKKYLNRMSPEVRDEFMKEQREAEMFSYIRLKPNGKYCVDLNLSAMDKNGRYESESANKEFDSFEDAMEFMKGFFEANPDMSTIDDFET